VIPPDASAAFVANMEDVLEVYQRPHDPQRPLVCLDETSKQLRLLTAYESVGSIGDPAGAIARVFHFVTASVLRVMTPMAS
jgi:hypothetical protein